MPARSFSPYRPSSGRHASPPVPLNDNLSPSGSTRSRDLRFLNLQATDRIMPGETQPQRSRPKEVAGGEEEAAAQLKLGEFQSVPTLSTSEARLLIQAVKERRSKTGQNMGQTEVLSKTEDYLDVFSRFKRKENVSAVERILDESPLQRFEKSQLGSLCCETAEEAKTLVPSVQNSMSDDELQTLLDEITKLRNFVE